MKMTVIRDKPRFCLELNEEEAILLWELLASIDDEGSHGSWHDVHRGMWDAVQDVMEQQNALMPLVIGETYTVKGS